VAALDDVVTLLPPPVRPFGAPFDWVDIELRLGTALPGDYKAYCDRYGHGGIATGWWLNPLTPDCPEPFFDLFDTTLRDYLADGDGTPFPAPGGLLAFASSELKSTFWWRTGGPSDTWPIVLEDDAGGFDGTRPPLPPEQVVIGWSETDGEHRISLDLGGVLGGSRADQLDAFLAWAPWYVRRGIARVEARGANEVVVLRSGVASPLVRVAAVQFVRRELRARAFVQDGGGRGA
jgi:hypothetical protein